MLHSCLCRASPEFLPASVSRLIVFAKCYLHCSVSIYGVIPYAACSIQAQQCAKLNSPSNPYALCPVADARCEYEIIIRFEHHSAAGFFQVILCIYNNNKQEKFQKKFRSPLHVLSSFQNIRDFKWM